MLFYFSVTSLFNGIYFVKYVSDEKANCGLFMPYLLHGLIQYNNTAEDGDKMFIQTGGDVKSTN